MIREGQSDDAVEQVWCQLSKKLLEDIGIKLIKPVVKTSVRLHSVFPAAILPTFVMFIFLLPDNV